MPQTLFPRDGSDYPLWLLLAAKQALFRIAEDPELEDARAILEKIEAALRDGPRS